MRTPGSDLPSTLGGDGWAARKASHIEEVKAGALWRRAGYRSEVSPLRAVALAWPPGSLAEIEDPASRLMLTRVDLGAMRAQADAIADTFRRNGIEVLMADYQAAAPPNIVFMRDLFLMTPAGAVIARMASAQRAGEERYAAAALAGAGYPILRTVTGAATFEGADALWLDDRTVAVGVGFRTNPAGLREVRAALHDQGAQAAAVPLNAGVQHLLGSVVMLDDRLAAIHGGASQRLRELLRERDYTVIAFEPDAEFVGARGMNLVTIAPRRVVMPAGAPTIRKRLEEAGVEVQAVDMGEYLKAAGGLGCVTGILHRDW